MKLEGIIVDADFCIKVGASPKYCYLEIVLMELADKVYIHKTVYDEILVPACAKTKSIPYFATDERDLQPIIDKILNTGLDDIMCVRIEDVIRRIKSGELGDFKRKDAKALWVLTGKNKDIFDRDIWPAEK